MERYVTVIGWSKHHRQMDENPMIMEAAKGPNEHATGYAVYRMNHDGTKTYIEVDADELITLKRCATILSDAERLTGNIYAGIDITDIAFDEQGKTIYEKKYVYSKRVNRLTIWERKNGARDLIPVYENWNGTINRDRGALADCLL